MMYFKVTMRKKTGVSGKYSKVIRRFARETIIDLLLFLEDYPLLQSELFGYEVRLISDITKEDYEAGKAEEDKSAFNMRHNDRIHLSENCLMEPISPDFFSSQAILGKTIDYSKGGFCVEYMDRPTRQGSIFQVSIKTLSTFKKEAEVGWTQSAHQGLNMSGLKWV